MASSSKSNGDLGADNNNVIDDSKDTCKHVVENNEAIPNGDQQQLVQWGNKAMVGKGQEKNLSMKWRVPDVDRPLKFAFLSDVYRRADQLEYARRVRIESHSDNSDSNDANL